jgi:hypothetical protein
VKGQRPSASELLPGSSHVFKFIVYERNFGDLDVIDERAAVRTAPRYPPQKMKAFLVDSANKGWLLGRMPSQAALDVLHWVDASTAPLS